MRERTAALPAGYTICAYMRLSNEDRDVFGRKEESGSITSQRRLIMDFIGRQPEFAGCRVIERCDDGLSGRYFDTRPQFTDMINLAKQGKVDCIIVKDCSRFGRDYVELGDYLEQLFPFLGVRFISVNDHYDSDRDEGGLDIAFKNLVYDIYSRDLSKKVRQARERMAAQGKYTAAQTLYGYRKKKADKHRLEPDPETAPVVREIFDMRLSGMGLADIARNLNDRGIPCPTVFLHGKGRPVTRKGNFERMCWTDSVVLTVLQNEIYTGAVVSLKSTVDSRKGKLVARPKDEWVRVDGMHEAVVTKEEFRQVQGMIKPQKPAAGKRKMRYACGLCGKRLIRRNRTDLYCNRGYMLKDCECRQVVMKEPEADAVVLGELKEKLRRVLDEEDLRLEKKSGIRPSGESRAGSLKNALDAAKKAKQRLFERLADREIDRVEFLEKKKAYDAEIAELEQRVSDAGMAEQLSRDADDEARERADAARSFLDADEMTEEIWERFVKEAFIYPDGRMEIHWNFEDETG